MDDMISRQEAINAVRTAKGKGEAHRMLIQLPPAQPVVISKSENTTECEDAVPRTSVEYICRKNTVSTNPYEHKYHDKFIQFMDDPEISDFGRWQHSNGFNTALVAVRCDLDKVPSVTPKQPGWIPCKTRKPEKSGLYLVTKQQKTGEIQLATAHYNTAFDEWSGNGNFKKVLAWQPLPSPWRGEKDA